MAAEARGPAFGAAETVKRIFGVAALIAMVAFALAPNPERRGMPERKRVRFWHMWTAEWADVVDQIAAEFNASQTEFEVVPLSVPAAGADTKFLLAVTGGDPPDLMAQWNAVIPTWADSGLIKPLDELMTPDERAHFQREAYPVVKKLGMYRGKLYGLAIGMNALGLYILPADLRRAGLDPDRLPESLEELERWGERLTVENRDKSLKRLGFLPLGFVHLMPLFGGGLYDWQTGKVHIDTPANRRALEWLVAHRRRIGYDRFIRFQSGMNTASFAGGWPFIGGAYSIAGDGAWRVEQLRKYAPDLEYRTAPMPPPKGGRPRGGFSGGNFMILPRGAKNVAGAWAFMKFWSGLENPERAAKYYTMGGWLPLSARIAEAPTYQAYVRRYPQFQTFLDLISSENLDVVPPVPYQVFLMDRVYRAEDLATRGAKTPAQALRDLEREVADERRRRRVLGYGE